MENRRDRHPVVILCRRDLMQILLGKGMNATAQAWALLDQDGPMPNRPRSGNSTQSNSETDY